MVESTVQSPAEIVVGSDEKKPIRVLHVDDEPALLKVAKQCLEMQGPFQIDTADSVEEASAKLEKEQYDAVVSDYRMRGKDGLEFLKQLRKKGNDIPFIILTGKGREEVAIKALNLGADRYLNKIGDPETVYCELAHSIRVAVERKKSKEALFAERDRLQTVTRSIGAGLAIISKDYRTLWANDILKRLFGDVEGKICYSAYNQRSSICPECGVKGIFEAGKAKVVHEQVGKDVDGKTVWSEITATPVKDRDGNITAALELVVPITERKKAEEALRETKEYLDNLLNYANAPVIVWDNEKKISLFNNAFEALTGHKKASVLGRNIDVLFPPSHKTEILETIERATQGEKWQSVEVPILCKDGETRIALWNSANIQDKDGNIVATIAQGQDITERNQAKKILQESEEKYRRLVENLQEGVWAIDKDSFTTFVNSRMAEVLGYTVDEMLGKHLFAFMDERGIEIAKRLLERRAQGIREQHDFEFVKKDGSRIYATLETSPINDSNGNYIGALAGVMDVTERKESEAELRRLATIVTDSNDAITVVDVDGRITAWNKGAEETYGYSKDEALGMDIFKIVPEDKKQETLDAIGKLKNNEAVGSFETKRLAKDGRVLDIWLTVTKLVDDKGNAVALATTERDITEKKRLEERLRFSERFTILGQLASSVAHEIRNPLGVIKNSVYFLNVRLKEHADKKVAKHLRIMEDNVNSADRIISDLLDLGRNKVGVLEQVDLNRILERAFANLSVPENIKVITKLDKIPKMLLDPERIQRVFVNIIQNAVAAMPKGGKLTVGLSRSGDLVKISFKDSGVGISEENMKKLFTPLFTTKTKGLGLGLAICNQIVEGHRGDIVVKSKVGEGALFIVRLPILSGTELVKTGLLHADVLTGGMSE